MPLDAGTRLGPYEILGPLGAGGMGEVYRARDTRLHRDVALKQSLQPFGERFQREARAIAALNHPNVCTVHDVGPDYLVMELLDRGGTWSHNGTIAVAVVGRGLWKVAASGGSLEAIGEDVHAAWPSFLPGDQSILFAVPASAAPRTLNSFDVIGLDGGGRRTVARRSDVEGPGDPVLGAGAEVGQGVVLASGQLVYGQDPGSVRALPIDPATLKVLGPSVLLADSVERGPAQGGIAFAVGGAGLLVYAGTGEAHRLAWVSRQGVATPLETEPDRYRLPRLSPDGTQIAVSVNDATRRPSIWLVDAVSGRRSRFGTGIDAAWAPDGKGVAASAADGPLLHALSGGSHQLIDRERLDAAIGRGIVAYPTGFSPDGRHLLVQANRGSQDVWRLSVSHRCAEPVLTGDWSEWGAVVSPNGRAVAYTSDESGRPEVYVAQWPDLGRRSAVSTRGGVVPRWSHDSRELFFWQGRTMMAARIDDALRPSPAQALFSGLYTGVSGAQGHDVAADGRFLVVQSDPRSALDRVTVLQHWTPAPATTP